MTRHGKAACVSLRAALQPQVASPVECEWCASAAAQTQPADYVNRSKHRGGCHYRNGLIDPCNYCFDFDGYYDYGDGVYVEDYDEDGGYDDDDGYGWWE